MEGSLDVNPRRAKYKIVTVHQPPFMYYNESTSLSFSLSNIASPINFIDLQIGLRVSSWTCSKI